MKFHRADIAKKMAEALQGKTLLSNASGGLFLAAPRRTGKTVFLREDLLPELEKRDITVVYVDLWSDKAKDPADLISEAIGLSIVSELGSVAKIAKKTGMTGIDVPGLGSFDVSKIGKPDGSTLFGALSHLQRLTKKPVALIVDEAQHALVSEAGLNAMFALKSARDQMNSPGNPQLMLIMSGSDRDKLLRLVNGNGSPFMGSAIVPMPVLDEKFVEFVLSHLVEQQPSLRTVEKSSLMQAFEMLGNRPQIFLTLIDQVNAFGILNVKDFSEQIIASAQAVQVEEMERIKSDFMGLTALEKAVLVCMIDRGANFKPYGGVENEFYTSYTGRSWSTPAVQQAIDRLRGMDEPLVWKSSRGEYAVETVVSKEWKKQLEQVSGWPPPCVDGARTRKRKRTI